MIPLHFHNGIFQFLQDEVVTQQVHEPFWALVGDPKWLSVDIDVKEAVDRRDSNQRDAALYALKALESTIKIVSDDKGWTNGREKGAASYIDNLVSAKNGRFIEPWESDALKALFRDLRNPHAHGPGSEPTIELTNQQQSWVIDASMTWIKSLITRL